MRSLLLFGCWCTLFHLSAQSVQLSGIINRYTAVSAFDSCSGRLTVSDTTGFRPGERALLIQMQGAAISTGNNTSFGVITSLNGAGRYELVVIDSVGAKAIFTRFLLLGLYDWSAGVQLVTFPRVQQATVADTLRAKPWDGATGGILALSVVDTLAVNAPVMADGAGFRGGQAYLAPTNNCTWLLGESDFVYSPGNWRGSYKGEGIAVTAADKALGRGPQANGGGGGNDHNAGGGGGGNGGPGGIGGDNDEPSTFGCDGYFPGLRGRALPADTGRLYLGGGGGAGHANNNLDSYGGRGGGIVFLEAGVLTGNAVRISADGQAGGVANGDGGGGGGAGGTIWLRAGSVSSTPVLLANGGAGGHTINNNLDRCFGPGGGGSGGRILTNVPGIPAPAGGPAGLISGSSNTCNGSSSGAEPGATGLVQPLPAAIPQGENPIGEPQAAFTTAVLGNLATFSNQSTGANSYLWDFGDGSTSNETEPQHIYNGVGSYTVTLYAISPCDTAIAVQTLDFLLPPLAAFMAPDSVVDCAAVTVNFQNQSSASATDFAWLFPGGSPATSTAANPQVTYPTSGIYPVTLIATNAAGADTAEHLLVVQVIQYPQADFSYTLMDDGTVQFTNLSLNAENYTWYFGDSSDVDHTLNAAHRYAESGVFTVTLVADNFCGTSVLQKTIEVVIVGTKTVEPGPAIRVYPNPAGIQLTVDCSALSTKPLHIQLIDGAGRVALQKRWGGAGGENLPVADIPPGYYTLVLQFEGDVMVKKVVILMRN